MSSASTTSAPVDGLDPSAQAWLARFETDADGALNDLLLGRVSLGGYGAAEVPQALPQFFPVALEDDLDEALGRWLAAQRQRGALPEGVTAKQLAQAIADAFTLLQAMALPRTLRRCREWAPALWAWLQTQPNSASREPRAALLRALALQQPDRGLLHFWMSLCRQGQKAWTQLALFGLRKMPRDDGTTESNLPLVLVNGLLDYGLALARGKDDAAKKKQWLAELDFLSAVYPMSPKQWTERLREALSVHSTSTELATVRHWAGERHPLADQPVPANFIRKLLPAPHWDNEIRPLCGRYDQMSASVRPELQALMARHLHYARESGDSYFLVRSNCRLAEFLLQSPGGATASISDESPRDAQWALELGQGAAAWAPGNPQTWSVVARALDALGDWPRARAVFWYARRRFPYNPFAHKQLGHALAMHGQVDEGAAVCRAAMRRFPDDPVVWADLGHTLRVAGRLEESLAVYRDAQQRFNHDAAIANALAGVLIDLRRTEDARAALKWAELVIPPGDVKNQDILSGQRRRWQALASRHPLPPKRLWTRPDVATGDWAALETAAGTTLRGLDWLGLATLWRQAVPTDTADSTVSIRRAAQALESAAEPLQRDARWQAERGLWLAADAGDAAASAFFDRMVVERPGDGVLAALQLRLHALSGESVEWQSLRARFDELAPLLRVAQDPRAALPAELHGALAAVTPAGGEPKLDDLSDDQRQALRVYQTAGDTEIADLVQQDFLAARQLTVF